MKVAMMHWQKLLFSTHRIDVAHIDYDNCRINKFSKTKLEQYLPYYSDSAHLSFSIWEIFNLKIMV